MTRRRRRQHDALKERRKLASNPRWLLGSAIQFKKSTELRNYVRVFLKSPTSAVSLCSGAVYRWDMEELSAFWGKRKRGRQFPRSAAFSQKMGSLLRQTWDYRWNCVLWSFLLSLAGQSESGDKRGGGDKRDYKARGWLATGEENLKKIGNLVEVEWGYPRMKTTRDVQQ